MKKITPLALVILVAFSAGCKTDGAKPTAAAWTYSDGSSYKATNGTLTGTLLESDCDDNNKIWITLGSVPTASTTMKIVNYSKSPLASDELKIDIAHGSSDYLSTGYDNRMATIDVTDGKVGVTFDTLTLERESGGGPAGDSTLVNGYLYQL